MSIIGKKFERLTVLEKDPIKKGYYICICDCGNKKSIAASNLYNFNTVSCGCYLIEKRKTHSDSKTRFYSIWKNMIGRGSACYFEKYTDLGTSVCERWLKYENFKEDMYESYLTHCSQFSEKDTTLERENNNGNYQQDNCKWATMKEQGNNRRTNKLFEAEYIIPGESFGYKEQSHSQKLLAENMDYQNSAFMVV